MKDSMCCSVGVVEVPQEAFMSILRLDRD